MLALLYLSNGVREIQFLTLFECGKAGA